MAARAEPIAKVRAMVPFTLIPIRVAAPLSSDTASIACPALERFINITSPAMIIIHVIIVTIVSPVTVSCPSARRRAGRVTTD